MKVGQILPKALMKVHKAWVWFLPKHLSDELLFELPISSSGWVEVSVSKKIVYNTSDRIQSAVNKIPPSKKTMGIITS